MLPALFLRKTRAAFRKNAFREGEARGGEKKVLDKRRGKCYTIAVDRTEVRHR